MNILLTWIATGIVLNLYPHVDECKLADNHDDRSDKDYKGKSFAVPPKNADQIRHDQDERHEG